MLNEKALKLMEQLKELQETVPFYRDLFYRVDSNGYVVISLEETFYDYESEPVKLMSILKNYCYEWYNSVEIEVYF